MEFSLISSFGSIFPIVTPSLYWAITIVWTVVLVLLVWRFGHAFRTRGLLTLLILILAIDAARTVIESVYFGALFGSLYGFFEPSVQEYLQSPTLLAIPKLVTLVSGLLVLIVIVGRWLPSAQQREDISRSAEAKLILEIEKQRERLLIAQSVAKVGSWETDLNTLEVEWSPETFRIFEKDPATFAPTHERFLELVDPNDREAVDAAFRKSFDSAELCLIEHQIEMPDGRKKTVVERWKTIVDESGRPRAIGTCQDITDIRSAETRALEALELLKVAGRAARLGGWSFDTASNRLFWSEETRKIHEVPDAFTPTVDAGINFYAPEFRQQIEKAFFTCLERGEPFEETLQIITAKGKRVWVKSIGFARLDHAGRVIGVHGAFQDISDLISREESLLLLETAVSRLNDIVIVTDADIDEPGPRIVLVNDAFEKITGYSKDETIGRSPRFLQGPKTDREVLDRIRNSLESSASFRGELLNYTKSGQEILLELEILPIANARGITSNFVAIERDITERKRLALEREDVGGRLDTLIREAKVGILVHRNFEPLVANKELARMLGYSSESEILQLDDARLLLADQERERISNYNAARMRGESVPAAYEVVGKMRDGSPIQLENRAFPVKWGEGTAVCVMLSDVSAQKKLEAQLRQAQRLEAVGQLTGGIAHDFNNLLLVILGNAELLEERLADDNELHNFAISVQKAALRGADLTGRLLSFARRQPLDPKAIDLSQTLKEMKELLVRAIGEHVDVRTLSSPGLWLAEVDPSQLENAILNLAINARDAMPGGGVLTIESSNVELDSDYTKDKLELLPGRYVLVAVSDTGVGMTSETIAQAFEPFFTTKEVGKGSGLGLSMVYGFAKQSRGHVAIYSELGKGTTVKLYLPKSSRTAALEQHVVPYESVPKGSEKILVVEDDDEVRSHVEGQLKSLGYEVVSVANGIEATEVLKNTADFDLLFTDVVMPKGVNGPALAEIARRLYPDLPVLFTSGYTENAIIHHGQLDKGTLLLAKPYRRVDLAEKVRAAMDRRNG